MKGVNRRVVEIAEPDSEYIERVLVFLRPQSGAVRVARQRAEAERYASGIVAWKRSLAPRFWCWPGRRCWALCSAGSPYIFYCKGQNPWRAAHECDIIGVIIG